MKTIKNNLTITANPICDCRYILLASMLSGTTISALIPDRWLLVEKSSLQNDHNFNSAVDNLFYSGPLARKTGENGDWSCGSPRRACPSKVFSALDQGVNDV